MGRQSESGDLLAIDANHGNGRLVLFQIGWIVQYIAHFQPEPPPPGDSMDHLFHHIAQMTLRLAVECDQFHGSGCQWSVISCQARYSHPLTTGNCKQATTRSIRTMFWAFPRP